MVKESKKKELKKKISKEELDKRKSSKEYLDKKSTENLDNKMSFNFSMKMDDKGINGSGSFIPSQDVNDEQKKMIEDSMKNIMQSFQKMFVTSQEVPRRKTNERNVSMVDFFDNIMRRERDRDERRYVDKFFRF